MFMYRQFSVLAIAFIVSWLALAPFAAAQQPEPNPDNKIVNLWQPGDSGQRLYIDGVVMSKAGQPLAGAELNLWQADGGGEYREDRYRTTLTTDQDGRYAFGTVLPGQYYGVKHIHVIVSHPDHASVQTRIIFKGDPYLDETSDRNAVFLEEAQVKGETVLYGRFDVMLP